MPDSLAKLRDLFQNPPTKHRSLPFWSWNNRLRPEEVDRQIVEMKQQGMGGFFMHARDGLETPYLGAEWMSAVKAAVTAAEREGMEAWLYDEDRWPSGPAGGMVVARGGDAFRAKGLTLEIISDCGYQSGDCGVLAVYLGRVEERRLIDCERLDPSQDHSFVANRFFLVLRCEVSGPSTIFRDEAPVDNLNPEAVATFIDITHNAYQREVGEAFGRVVPGIFTDEPSIGSLQNAFTETRGWLPWTRGLDDLFREKRGYDMLDQAAYLFFDGSPATKIRHDFWRTVTERYGESYFQQIGDWCATHGLVFTGHLMAESELGTATRENGAVMPHLRWMDHPGIDLLGLQTDEVLTVKQCTSVARQYGKTGVIAEIYGGAGWGFTFLDQKWIGDWLYVQGVDRRCQHLAQYSLRGLRKRDYPPAFSYQTPWWPENHVIEDYFARLGAVLTQGEPVRDILVLHPGSTAWTMQGAEPVRPREWWINPDPTRVNEFGERFNQFLQNMLAWHEDFDLGDEMLLAESGQAGDEILRINDCKYRVVILHSIQSIFRSTLELLRQFLASGGKVILHGAFPEMVEGEASTEPARVLSHPNCTIVSLEEEIRGILAGIRPQLVSIERMDGAGEAVEFLTMLRKQGEDSILFIVNHDRERGYQVRITVDGTGGVEVWDPLTGKVTGILVTWEKDGKVSFQAEFEPAAARVFVISKGVPVLKESDLEPKPQAKRLLAGLGPVWCFSRTMPNALTLDFCRYRINMGEWSGLLQVREAVKEIRNTLGFYQGGVQRYKWIHQSHPRNGTPVAFKFEFGVRELPKGDLDLVLETARNYSIHCNGKEIPVRTSGWFLDRSFDRVRLSGVKTGKNEVVIACAYSNRTEFEDCYLIGDFALDRERNLIREGETIRTGDWTLQGYMHYCGNMIYHGEFRVPENAGAKIHLELGAWEGVGLVVRLNGEKAGSILHQGGGEMDLTPWVRPGLNQLELEVLGSPRNLLGPLHRVDDGSLWTDPGSFQPGGNMYTPDYVVKEYGLRERVGIFVY